jgi:hypothetical protein
MFKIFQQISCLFGIHSYSPWSTADFTTWGRTWKVRHCKHCKHMDWEVE